MRISHSLNLIADVSCVDFWVDVQVNIRYPLNLLMTFDVCLTSLLITEYSYRRPNICYCFFEFLILFPVRGSMLSIRLILLNSCAFQCLFLLYGLGYSILSKSFGFLYSSLDITSPVSTLTMIPGLISLKSTICVKMNRFLLLSSK